jgi:Zn-dependent carboxypeptidase
MREAMKKLISLDRERGVITHIAALLGWDQETYMPESGIDERAEQLAIVENLAHEKAVNPGIGELLNRLEGEKDLSGQEKAYLRVSRREYDKETKLPAGLVSEMARQTSLSQAAWVQARKNNDFKRFAPHLATMIRLNLEKASAPEPRRSSLRCPPGPLRDREHRKVDRRCIRRHEARSGGNSGRDQVETAERR